MIIPSYSIVDMNYEKNITLKINEEILLNKSNISKSLDLINETIGDEEKEMYNLKHNNNQNTIFNENMENNRILRSNSLSNSDPLDNISNNMKEEQHENLIYNNQLTEILLQNFLGLNKSKKNKRKIGMLKEGYLQFYGINPINRYNFTIDRYNDDVNTVSNIKLTRVPIPKIFSRFLDLFIFLSRILLGVFLIISYYSSSYIYKKNSNTINKARLISYKKYLLDDNNFYKQADKPSCLLVFVCIIFIIFSLFLIFSLYFVMLIPISFFTLYLFLAVIINFYNKRKLDNKSQNIYENMILENKLDDKYQLNDYIKVNKISMKYYKGFPYYNRIKEIYKRKGKNDTIHIMLYGNLFVREHDIINKSFINVFIGFGIYLIIGYFIYHNQILF